MGEIVPHVGASERELHGDQLSLRAPERLFATGHALGSLGFVEGLCSDEKKIKILRDGEISSVGENSVHPRTFSHWVSNNMH